MQINIITDKTTVKLKMITESSTIFETENVTIDNVSKDVLLHLFTNKLDNHDHIYKKDEHSISGMFIALYVLFIVLILCGNGMVVLLVICKKDLRTTTNLYILSLCISDIAVGLFAITDDIMAHFNENFMTSFACKSLEYVVHVALCSNIYSVLCIALDRFRAVIYPFASKYAKKQCIISISGVWIFSFLYSVRAIYWFDMVKEDYIHKGQLYTYHQCAIPKTAEKLLHDFVIVDFMMIYLAPLVFINILHAFIIRKLRNDKLKIVPHTKERKQRQNRIVKMLFVIVVLFAVCQLPEHIYKLYRYQIGTFKNFLIVHEVCDLITFCNSWLNVVVYVIMNDNFAKQLKRIFRIGSQGNNNSGPSDENQDRSTLHRRSNLVSKGIQGKSSVFERSDNPLSRGGHRDSQNSRKPAESSSIFIVGK